MILYSLLRFPNFSLYVLEFGLSPVPRSSKESPVLYQIQSCLGQPCREGSCTSELWQFYSYMCLFKPFVAFQRLLWQSIVLLLGIGYTFRQGFVPDHQKKKIWFCWFMKTFHFQYKHLGGCFTCLGGLLRLVAGWFGGVGVMHGVGALCGCACTGTRLVRCVSVIWSLSP